MQIYIVKILVKPDSIEPFIQATLENAEQSRMEPGIMRFEFARQNDDPHRFILIEAYRTPEAVTRHKETDHYLKWKETVAEMMAEPRQGLKFTPLTPIPAMLG